MLESINLAGKDYSVIGTSTAASGTFPIADIPLMSDYKWQENALKSRLLHPENYPNEDVPRSITRIREWLRANRKAVSA